MKHLYTLVIATFLLHYSAYAQGWEPLGSGSNSLKAKGGIYSLCYDNGIIYAGGYLIDEAGRSYIAKWNGTAWEQLSASGSALNGVTLTALFV